MTREERVKLIIQRLKAVYPNPKTALYFNSPLDLLVATILSAQANDKVVNQVTPKLFDQYETASDYAGSSTGEIDRMISRINFHNNKAKSIYEMSKVLVSKFQGEVPDNMEDLDSLPGVARKTANVVLGAAFHKAEGIVVDTHVMRLARRLKLTDEKKPEKIERDLMMIVPKEEWINFSLYLINFGREYCPARKHVCRDCPLRDMCPDEG